MQSTTASLHWQPCNDRKEWEALAGRIHRVPLQQSWAYGLAVQRLGGSTSRAVLLREGEAVARVQWQRRRFLRGLVQVAHVPCGPLWCDGADASLNMHDMRHIYRDLRAGYGVWRARPMFLTPSMPENISSITRLRACRLQRVMTGASTVWINLQQSQDALCESMHPKWRASLHKAEAAGLRCAVCTAEQDYAWLLAQEEAQRQAVGYRALPVAFVEAFSRATNQQGVICVQAGKGRSAAKQPMAGMLFLLHEGSATYHLGWNGEHGRDVHAHHLLLWQAIKALKARGIRWLDLGGVNTTDEGAGIARFKLGTGGEVHTLAGTFV